MRVSRVLPVDPEHDCKIAIVGEAPGEAEAEKGIPFIGKIGEELTNMLAEAGIVREECLITSVFTDKPPRNDITSWCLKKRDADAAWAALGNAGKYPLPPIRAGQYLMPERLNELSRLFAELRAYSPHVIIALGSIALWALCGESGISKVRGTVLEASIGGPRKYKVLPTYHPAYIFRNWDERLIVVADLMKAKRESASETYSRPERELWLEPELSDIKDFLFYLLTVPHFAIDIETAREQITCIGFGTREKAICIPFVDERKANKSYWPTADDELSAWDYVRQILLLPDQSKIFQNGMYDMQWLWRKMGLTVAGNIHDTMLLHHSMFPEMRKSLGFLGSIYTNESAWKRLRPKKTTLAKREDIDQ